MAGPTLDEMVRGRGPLSGQGLRRLAHGMAEALTAIHAAGVVHRDLKPGNVMLTDDRPIVIDFGIAQTGDATRLTQTGLVMGTPGYLAPEVIEGQPSSPASDVHSWGSTMAFAATGHLPFGGGSYETIFYRIVSGRADLTGVPAPLVPLISAALARDPSHRPSASWLSAQATALDMSAVGPAGPDGRVHRLGVRADPGPAAAAPGPGAHAPRGGRTRGGRARGPARGRRARGALRSRTPRPRRPSRRPGTSPTCCRRSTTRRPESPKPQKPQKSSPARPASARGLPRPGRTLGPRAARSPPRPARAPRPARTPWPASPSWSRPWR